MIDPVDDILWNAIKAYLLRPENLDERDPSKVQKGLEVCSDEEKHKILEILRHQVANIISLGRYDDPFS